jgi:cation diffusion facilitator family transporter
MFGDAGAGRYPGGPARTAINAAMAASKLLAGIVGHTYALIADAIESTIDIFSSLIVWAGLSVAARPADEDHPYGHGKAEALAGAAVSIILIVVALGIAAGAIREIRTPHDVPAPWTLLVLAVVMAVKFWMYRQAGCAPPSERRADVRCRVRRDRRRGDRTPDAPCLELGERG